MPPVLNPSTPGVSPDLVLLGIDASWAPIAEREALRYDAAATAALLSEAGTIDGLDEAIVLSTCNRTEFYLVATATAVAAFRARVCHRSATHVRPSIAGHTAALRFETGDTVVRHACEVASGVASTILGDSFIVRQMKEALTLASAHGTLGPVLSHLFELAFATSRQARQRTDIARGETGLGAVIASVITTRKPGNPRILLIGAGVTARDIARQIDKRRIGQLRVTNRSQVNGEGLARSARAVWCEWDALGREVADADVVICATSAPEPIISTDMLGSHRQLLVDVGVPRNIEASPDRACLVVDDLVALQDDANERRTAAVAGVLAIVEEAMAEWHAWTHALPLESHLKTLFADEAAVRKQIAADLVTHGWNGTLLEAEQFVARRTAPLLKRHAAQLRQWARRAPAQHESRREDPAHSMRA